MVSHSHGRTHHPPKTAASIVIRGSHIDDENFFETSDNEVVSFNAPPRNG